MCVDINKTRRDDKSGRINLLPRRAGDFSYGRDASVFHGDIRVIAGIACAIHDEAVTDDDIKVFRAAKYR